MQVFLKEVYRDSLHERERRSVLQWYPFYRAFIYYTYGLLRIDTGHSCTIHQCAMNNGIDTFRFNQAPASSSSSTTAIMTTIHFCTQSGRHHHCQPNKRPCMENVNRTRNNGNVVDSYMCAMSLTISGADSEFTHEYYGNDSAYCRASMMTTSTSSSFVQKRYKEKQQPQQCDLYDDGGDFTVMNNDDDDNDNKKSERLANVTTTTTAVKLQKEQRASSRALLSAKSTMESMIKQWRQRIVSRTCRSLQTTHLFCPVAGFQYAQETSTYEHAVGNGASVNRTDGHLWRTFPSTEVFAASILSKGKEEGEMKAIESRLRDLSPSKLPLDYQASCLVEYRGNVSDQLTMSAVGGDYFWSDYFDNFAIDDESLLQLANVITVATATPHTRRHCDSVASSLSSSVFDDEEMTTLEEEEEEGEEESNKLFMDNVKTRFDFVYVPLLEKDEDGDSNDDANNKQQQQQKRKQSLSDIYEFRRALVKDIERFEHQWSNIGKVLEHALEKSLKRLRIDLNNDKTRLLFVGDRELIEQVVFPTALNQAIVALAGNRWLYYKGYNDVLGVSSKKVYKLFTKRGLVLALIEAGMTQAISSLFNIHTNNDLDPVHRAWILPNLVQFTIQDVVGLY